MAGLNERFEKEAAALGSDDVLLKQPISVLLGEAIDVCGFCKKYWKPQLSPTGELMQPGLEMAGERLPGGIVEEISLLERKTYEAHKQYMIAVGPAGTDHSRATFVLGELVQGLDFAFDDPSDPAWQARLAKLHEQHDGHVDNQDGLALALEDYAAVAELGRKQLKQIPAFHLELIAEARSLAGSVRQLSAPRDNPEVSRALDRRNRFATLLTQRLQRVRRAVRYVFRGKPNIARQATSSYERRKRSASRRRATAKPDAVPVVE